MSVRAEGDFPRFAPAGDGALVIELGREISRSLNESVRELDASIRLARLPEVIATVPSYTSLLVYYDPGIVLFDELVKKLRNVPQLSCAEKSARNCWTLPACYESNIGFDLEPLAERLNLSAAEVVKLHSSVEYMVYMIGFAPGFAYLGELPAALTVPRKTDIVLEIPSGTIQVGGMQTAISSMPMPTGWYIVGRTPAILYDERRSRPFLLEAGDYVRFVAIPASEFEVLADAAARGEFTPKHSTL